MSPELFLLAIMILALIIMGIYYLVEKKKEEKAVIESREFAKRKEKAEIERFIRNYITFTEQYKNKEFGPLLNIENAGNIYFYKNNIYFTEACFHYPGEISEKPFLGTFILTDKQVILIYRSKDGLKAFKLNEIDFIHLAINRLEIALPPFSIILSSSMEEVTRVEKIAEKLNIPIKKADKLINPTANPDLDKDVETFFKH